MCQMVGCVKPQFTFSIFGRVKGFNCDALRGVPDQFFGIFSLQFFFGHLEPFWIDWYWADNTAI